MAASAAAQTGNVQISLRPAFPVAGISVDAQVRFLETTPTAVSILVRSVGETAFQELEATDQGDNLWTVLVPFPIPPQGLEVYASYVEDGVVKTEPVQNPSGAPYRVPALIPTATSGVTLQARQYRMVSVPVLLGEAEGVPATLGSDDPLDVFGDDFGADGDPAQWRLLRWDPFVEAYRDAIRDRATFERVRPGAGYWLIASRGGTFDVEAGLSTGVAFVDGLPRASEVTIPLRAGWNQIGNPFLFPIRWADVGRPAGTNDPVAFTGSFVGGQTTLQPWEGYLVFNPGPEGALRFRALPGGGRLRRADARRAGPRTGRRWRGGAPGDGRRGRRPGRGHPRAGRARPRRPGPSTSASPRPSTAASRLAVRADGHDWLSHFRPSADSGWTLALTPPDGGPVDLRLAPLGDWPELVVEDLDRGEVLPVVGGRVLVASVAGVSTRRLSVRARSASVSARAGPVALSAPRPNPSARCRHGRRHGLWPGPSRRGRRAGAGRPHAGPRLGRHDGDLGRTRRLGPAGRGGRLPRPALDRGRHGHRPRHAALA